MKILTNTKSYQLKVIISEKGTTRSHYLVSGQSITSSGQIEFADKGIRIADKPKRVNRKSKSIENDSHNEQQTTMEIENNEL